MNSLKRKNCAGFSLIEVVIASAILAVVMIVSYTILYSTTNTATRGEMTAGLEARGKKVTEALKTAFYDAEYSNLANYTAGVNAPPTFSPFPGIHDGNTQIHFQVALHQGSGGGMLYGFIGNKVQNYQDLSDMAGLSCVIRFEPEIVLYEGTSATPAVLQPAELDTSAPPFKPNPYTGTTLAAGTPLPTKLLNKDLNGDGVKTSVFVMGKIWKYVMNPYPYTGLQVLTTECLSDNVVLAVAANGTFTGDVDGPTPAGQPAGKDALFRFLKSEPAPPTPYGNTDMTIFGPSPVQSFPSAVSVAIAFTVWHAVEDDRGKSYFFRKSWDKVPFRLSSGN